MSAADAAVCQCGHPKRYHDPDCIECRIHDGLCFVFCADVNRPECGKCGHDRHGHLRCGAVEDDDSCACDESVAASDRGAGELADLLAAHAPSHQVDGDYGETQWIECICDSEYFVDTDAGWDEHRAHVAAVLIAAGWEKR